MRTTLLTPSGVGYGYSHVRNCATLNGKVIADERPPKMPPAAFEIMDRPHGADNETQLSPTIVAPNQCEKTGKAEQTNHTP